MPRGQGRLDVRHSNVAEIENCCRSPANIRVGATNDPLARARSYEQHGVNGRFFAGTFVYVQARNARQAENRLLAISKQFGRGQLNKQWVSNYQDVPGYVYVIMARRPGGQGQQECCTIS